MADVHARVQARALAPGCEPCYTPRMGRQQQEGRTVTKWNWNVKGWVGDPRKGTSPVEFPVTATTREEAESVARRVAPSMTVTSAEVTGPWESMSHAR